MIPDMDFVRVILLHSVPERRRLPEAWRARDDIIAHQLYLAHAGLAHVKSHRGDNTVAVAVVTGLTPLGERLLDAIRDDTLWAQLKERLPESLGDVSIETIIDLAELIQRSQRLSGNEEGKNVIKES